MNPLFRAIDRVVEVFNDSPIWKGECRVWDQRMTSPTFERWLYLRMHRLGLMGRDERTFLEAHVRTGMRVLDVGSNLGLYSILMARLAGPDGRVICFEPEPDMFAALKQNGALNSAGCIEGHNLALGSASANLTLHRSVLNSGDNHLGQIKNDLFRRTISVEVVRLDTFLPELLLDLVKIDVQGWELEALRGMRQTLETNPGIQVYFEFSPLGYTRVGSTYEELISFLREVGFRVYDPIARVELDDGAIARLAVSLGRKGYTNLVAARKLPWAK